MNTKVLIISMGIGAGHGMVAQTLEEKLKNEKNQVQVADILDFLPAIFWKIRSWYYAFLNSSGFVLLNLREFANNHYWLRDKLAEYLYVKMEKFLEKGNFTEIYATHVLGLGVGTLWKKNHKNVLLHGIITDFYVHPWWYAEEVNDYCLPHYSVNHACLQNKKIISYQMPLRKIFYSNTENSKEKNQELILVICGGGAGILPMEDIVDALLKLNLSGLKLQVFCGHNEKLRLKLTQKANKNLQVFGFCEDFPHYMLQGDVLLTKPGGVTVAEAMAAGKKILLFRPISGTEKANAAFVEQWGKGKIVKNIKEIIQELKKMLTIK